MTFANGATGRITDNAIRGLASAGYTTPLICPGIYLTGAGDGVKVMRNRISNAFDGINTDASNAWIAADDRIIDSRNEGFLVPGSKRGLAEDNVVRGSLARGIVLGGFGGLTAAGGFYGRPAAALLSDARNNTFRRNLSTDNVKRDCLDPSTGTRTLGTANRWVGNHSDGADLPDGICPR